MTTITTANVVIMLTVPGLYDTPVKIEGFASDAAFASDSVNNAELLMGIDGRLSGGFVPVATPFNVTLQADSPLNVVFENWQATQETTKELLPGNMTAVFPSTGRKYSGTRGFLNNIVKVPTGQKTLQPRTYGMMFESLQPAAA